VSPKPIPWAALLLAVWAAGGAPGALRLVRLRWQLSRLCRETSPPPPELGELAGQIQRRLAVRRAVAVQVSEHVASPFVCGLWRPVILLPRRLLAHLEPGETTALLSHEIAHSFALTNPVTRIEVVTESAATLELTAKTKGGKTIAGASVYLSPNVIRMANGIFGWMSDSSEASFRTIPPLPQLRYFATTDTNGVAIVRNIPAFDRIVVVGHRQYQVPLQEPSGMRDRIILTKYTPGATNHFELTMEPKGTDYIGKN